MHCKMENDQNTTENLPAKNSAGGEPISPLFLLPPIEKCGAVSRTTLASPPVTMSIDESQDTEMKMHASTVMMEVT